MSTREFRRWAIVLLAAAAVGLSPVSAGAGGAGTAGASFLKVGIGARAAAMGGAYTGLADDVFGMRWNPAGLARLRHPQLGAQHLNEFADANLEYAGLAAPLGRRAAIGADVVSLRTEDSIRSELEDLGSFTNHDLAAGICVAGVVTDELAVGVGSRLLSRKLETSTARGWAIDLGVLWRPPGSPLSVGAAARNLGPALTFDRLGDPLPRVLAAGVGYRLFADRLLLAADVGLPNDDEPYGTMGMEYRPLAAFALRAGYAINTGFTGLEAASAGVGFRFGPFAIDYAFVPRRELGAVHRIGVQYEFEPSDQPQPSPQASDTAARGPQTGSGEPTLVEESARAAGPGSDLLTEPGNGDIISSNE